MSFESGEVLHSPVSLPQSWSEVWVKAITQPTVATYQDFVSRPDVTTRRAYTWVFVSSLIGSSLSVLGVFLRGSFSAIIADQALDVGAQFGSAIFGLLCLAPFTGLFAIIGLAIIAGVSQAIARALGGTGSYSKLAYAFAAYLAPLGLIGSLLGIVPFLNYLTIPITIYGLFLNIMAVKSVHDFSWGKALASSVLILVLILSLVAVVVIVFLALLGPAIGNVFSNIILDI